MQCGVVQGGETLNGSFMELLMSGFVNEGMREMGYWGLGDVGLGGRGVGRRRVEWRPLIKPHFYGLSWGQNVLWFPM